MNQNIPSKKRLGQYELEVGLSPDERDVVVNHPEMTPNPGGEGGHIVFSPQQARDFAALMLKKAGECVGQSPGETREAHEVTAACVEHDCPCQRPRCDRAEILVQRAVNCGWIQCLGEHGRRQLQTTARIALDAEVEAGGPYLTPAAPTLVWQCCEVWYGPAREACSICKKPRPAVKTSAEYGAHCRLHPAAMFKPIEGCPTCEVGGAPYVLDAEGNAV